MPRVYTQKAGKDYPAAGIKKGDTYYQWSFFRGPTQRSKTPPRPSQLTGNVTLGAAYEAQEALEDAISEAKTLEDISSALDTIIEDDSIVSGFEEKIANLEEVFRGGCPAIDEANEHKDNWESYLDELRSAKDEVEALDAADYTAAAEQREIGKPEPEGFDDLGSIGQDAMLDAAREIVNACGYQS
jgi:hypothetical protein